MKTSLESRVNRDEPELPLQNHAEGDRRHRAVLGKLWSVAALLVVFAWVHVFGLIVESRRNALLGAERDLSNLTRVSQEHADRTLRGADQVIRFVQAQYLAQGDALDLVGLTRQGIIDAEIFNQVGVIDSKGLYVLSSLPGAKRLDLSDREHFRVHIAADTGQMYVSKPVLGRASGKWSIQLTRRITRPGGEFAGVVVVSIDSRYFTRFYGDLNLGPQGLSALYGLDGVARARRVGDKEFYGANAASSSVFNLVANGTTNGTYTQRSVVDGVERVYYFRRIPEYPLLVIAGVDMNDLLANHRDARAGLLLQASLVSLLIIALATALTRHLRQMRSEAMARGLAQAQIEERTEQRNAIFAMSPDGFVSFDRERRVKYVSPAFTRMMATKGAALEGMPDIHFWDWMSERCNPATPMPDLNQLRLASADSGRSGLPRVELTGPGTRVLQVDLRTSQSAFVSQIMYFRDVTHESEVERLKSDFLATAAHELRTPMASIYGFSEVLLHEEQDAETRREFTEIIYSQAQLMVRILDELLDLARIEARKGKDFHYTRVCVQDLARELVKAHHWPADRMPPELSVPEVPVHVLADADKLRQVLLNVLVNAYKFSPAGGPVTIALDVRHPALPQPMVSIHVQDHGIGMTPEQVEKVCARFYRGDPSGKVAGAGLGMSIVKEIVELMHGEVNIASRLGDGTRVTINLPADVDTPLTPDHSPLPNTLAARPTPRVVEGAAG
jgi:signal transduction histidine kinase